MPLLQIGKEKQAFPEIKDRVYFSISSEGFGHSSRALAVARYLNSDNLLIGTYSYALERVQAWGYPNVEVPQELKFIGAAGSFDVGKTILQNRNRALGFNQIVDAEMQIMKKYGISLVVADGRMAAVLAAERLDLPCLVVTNQSAFYPFFEQDSPLVQLFGKSFEWVMKYWLSSAEEILIPDFPPPDTVCLPNLSDKFEVKKRTRFVGPLVAWQAEEVTPIERDQNQPLIVVGLGGHSYRRPLFDAVIDLAKTMPNIRFELLTPFTAPDVPENVGLHETIKDAAPFFKAADFVITQGGHSTAMELLTLGKPSIVVPDTKQIEQENNARRLAELGCAINISYDHLQDHASGSGLKQAIETMLATRSFYDKASELAQKAHEINGARHAAGVLTDYAHRLLAY